MKPPRFSIRALLVVVTIAGVLFAIGRRLYVERPVFERETKGVTVGMTTLEVRWRLGPPHFDFNDPMDDSWGFEYADSEQLPLDYFYVRFEGGNVIKVVGRQPYAPKH